MHHCSANFCALKWFSSRFFQYGSIVFHSKLNDALCLYLYVFVRIIGSLCGRTLVEFYQMKLSILLICKICKLIKLPEVFDIFWQSNQENIVCISCSDLSRNFIQGPIPYSWADLPVFNLYALHCSHSFVRSIHVCFIQHSCLTTGLSREIAYLEPYRRSLDTCPSWNLCELHMCVHYNLHVPASCGGKTERRKELSTVT